MKTSNHSPQAEELCVTNPQALTRSCVPKLHVPFSDQDMQTVIIGARRVLNEIGIQCSSEKIRKLLTSLPGARQAGDRIYYNDTVVDAILADSRAKTTEPAPTRAPFTMGPPTSCLQIADWVANQTRPAINADAVRAVRLLEGLGVSASKSPLAENDVSPEMRNLAGWRTLLKHSRSGTMLTNPPVPEQIPAVIDMGAAAGREPDAHIMAMISPLRYETNSLEYFLQYRQQRGLRMRIGGSLPCTGLTSPLHLPGTLIQSLAEVLGMEACARALNCPPRPISSCRCDPCDMRTGNYVIGSPEYHLLDMASRALHHAITGAASTSGDFRTMAKFPDAQAMAERCFGVLFQVLQGARHFNHAGQLSLDELFSPEQVILDYEILRNVERIVLGMDWQEEIGGADAGNDVIEMIRRGAQAGNYLESDETINGYREFFYSSKLFGYEKLQTWVGNGAKSVLSCAHQRVEEIVKTTPECVLSADRAREVDRIFEHACRKFV
ncbi:MAG: trimethylamine methyltransferase family protein [Planctomycetota bacterium]